MSREWQRAHFWDADPLAAVPPELDAFGRGFEEGRRTVEAELAAEREALLQLAGAIEAIEPLPAGPLATLMIAAVERLVGDIAGNAPVDAALLSERAQTLARAIAAEADATLALHPDDAALLDSDQFAIPIVPDPSLSRGTVQARARNTVLEDGVKTALDRLRFQIEALGLAT